jgi:DegV family protein with EDD domain
VVAIVTDSAANIPSALAGDLGIQVVPMYLNFGDQVYRDGLDITPADFYERLVRDRDLATTSTPSPGDFLEAYQRTGAPEIVCITIASGMSSSGAQAVLAGQQFGGAIEVVDSMNASLGEGFVALEAARMARSGAGMADVVARAKEVAGRARLLATVDTFEFLRRSGRVSKLQAYAATLLDIKPVFRFEGGDASPVARPRTRSRALSRVVEETLREIGGKPVHLAAVHAAAEERANEVADRIEAVADVVERLVVEVTPVVGAHTGPGLVGTAFFTEE